MSRLKLHAEKAKNEEISAKESLEAKEALFARAVEENEVLKLSFSFPSLNYRAAIHLALTCNRRRPCISCHLVVQNSMDGEDFKGGGEGKNMTNMCVEITLYTVVGRNGHGFFKWHGDNALILPMSHK